MGLGSSVNQTRFASQTRSCGADIPHINVCEEKIIDQGMFARELFTVLNGLVVHSPLVMPPPVVSWMRINGLVISLEAATKPPIDNYTVYETASENARLLLQSN